MYAGRVDNRITIMDLPVCASNKYGGVKDVIKSVSDRIAQRDEIAEGGSKLYVNRMNGIVRTGWRTAEERRSPFTSMPPEPNRSVS